MAWLERLFGRQRHADAQAARAKAPLRYPTVSYYATMASVPEHLSKGEMAIVGDVGLPKWAVFDCPCDRPHRVQVSLQRTHRPHWRLNVRSGLPSITPSVWMDKPTGCHFWIVDGRVYWDGHRRRRTKQGI